MEEKKYNFGEKSKEYPYGYGYCQCGCGKKTTRLSNGISLKYRAHHKIKMEFKQKIGKIKKGFEKGFGLCQCGCGKLTMVDWQYKGEELFPVVNKYYKFHYAKTEESRKKQSIVGTRVLKERDYSPFANYGRSEHGLYFSNKLGCEIGYMSTYEKIAFEILDSDPSIESYAPQPFGIEYNYEGRQRTYNPDVLIYYRDGRKAIVEVKPKLLLEKPLNKAKLEALRDFCRQRDFGFEIWDEDVLESKTKLLLPGSV